MAMMTILAAVLTYVKADIAAETTCLMGPTVPNCSGFQAFPAVKDFDPLARHESLNLLQTKAVLSKPRKSTTKVYITRPVHRFGHSRYEELLRPLWQKTLRCSGPTMDDCEECVGKKNCWGDCRSKNLKRVGIDRCVQVDSRNIWTRFVVLIHIRCDLSMMVKFRPVEVRGGVFKIYWDDEFLKTFSKKMKFPRSWQRPPDVEQ